MTVAELIKRLEKLDPNQEIMILDSFNGAGQPRTINFGPVAVEIAPENLEDNCDCEEKKLGEEVIMIGFGCY